MTRRSAVTVLDAAKNTTAYRVGNAYSAVEIISVTLRYIDV